MTWNTPSKTVSKKGAAPGTRGPLAPFFLPKLKQNSYVLFHIVYAVVERFKRITLCCAAGSLEPN